MLIYRELPFEEWDKAKPLINQLFPGFTMPNPEVARILVAELGGKVIAFWFLQLCAHAEPVGVDPQYGHLVSLPKLREALHESLIGCAGMEYYIYTATPDWDKPLQRAGFRPIGTAYAATVPEVTTES